MLADDAVHVAEAAIEFAPRSARQFELPKPPTRRPAGTSTARFVEEPAWDG